MLLEHGPIDVYLDLSPPPAAISTRMRSAVAPLEFGGRVSLMGGILEDVTIDYGLIMFNNLTLKGTYLYKRAQAMAFIKMVESGVTKLGKAGGVELVGAFTLDQSQEAFDVAAENNGPTQFTVITP